MHLLFTYLSLEVNLINIKVFRTFLFSPLKHAFVKAITSLVVVDAINEIRISIAIINGIKHMDRTRSKNRKTTAI